jgi:hypothetical protein
MSMIDIFLFSSLVFSHIIIMLFSMSDKDVLTAIKEFSIDVAVVPITLFAFLCYMKEPAVRPDDFCRSAYLFCFQCTVLVLTTRRLSFFLAVNTLCALFLSILHIIYIYIYIFAFIRLTAFLFIDVAHSRDANTPKHCIIKERRRRGIHLIRIFFFLSISFWFERTRKKKRKT